MKEVQIKLLIQVLSEIFSFPYSGCYNDLNYERCS